MKRVFFFTPLLNSFIFRKLHHDSALLAKKKGVNLNEVVKAALSYMVQHEDLVNKESLSVYP